MAPYGSPAAPYGVLRHVTGSCGDLQGLMAPYVVLRRFTGSYGTLWGLAVPYGGLAAPYGGLSAPYGVLEALEKRRPPLFRGFTKDNVLLFYGKV